MQLEFRFTALLWPISGTKHTCTHACTYTDTVLQTQVFAKPANSRIIIFYPVLFQLFWVPALWQRFFWLQLQITVVLASLRAWNMRFSVDEQLLNVTFFPPHLVALILHKPNPLPRTILFISSWANKWVLQVITRRCESLYSHQWICSRVWEGEDMRKLEGSNMDFHVSVPGNWCLGHVLKAHHTGKYCDQWQIFSKSNLPSVTEPTLQRTRNTSVTSCDKSTYLQFPPHTQSLD